MIFFLLVIVAFQIHANITLSWSLLKSSRTPTRQSQWRTISGLWHRRVSCLLGCRCLENIPKLLMIWWINNFYFCSLNCTFHRSTVWKMLTVWRRISLLGSWRCRIGNEHQGFCQNLNFIWCNGDIYFLISGFNVKTAHTPSVCKSMFNELCRHVVGLNNQYFGDQLDVSLSLGQLKVSDYFRWKMYHSKYFKVK